MGFHEHTARQRLATRCRSAAEAIGVSEIQVSDWIRRGYLKADVVGLQRHPPGL